MESIASSLGFRSVSYGFSWWSYILTVRLRRSIGTLRRTMPPHLQRQALKTLHFHPHVQMTSQTHVTLVQPFLLVSGESWDELFNARWLICYLRSDWSTLPLSHPPTLRLHGIFDLSYYIFLWSHQFRSQSYWPPLLIDSSFSYTMINGFTEFIPLEKSFVVLLDGHHHLPVRPQARLLSKDPSSYRPFFR